MTEVFQYFKIKTKMNSNEFEIEIQGPEIFSVRTGSGNMPSELGLDPKMRELIDELTDKFSVINVIKQNKLSSKI